MRGLATVPPCVLQLDQICISFDKGKTTMNFIEAALLIQGSACVYSKQVGPPGCGLELQCLVGLRSTVSLGQVAGSALSLSCLSSTSHLLLQVLAPFNREEQNGFKIVGLGIPWWSSSWDSMLPGDGFASWVGD